MIPAIFLNMFYNFLAFVLTPILSLPSVSLDAGFGSALAAIGGYVGVLDMVFPVGELILLFVGFHLVVEGWVFAYKLIKWAYSKIPGIN